jgi:hypothetical protein
VRRSTSTRRLSTRPAYESVAVEALSDHGRSRSGSDPPATIPRRRHSRRRGIVCLPRLPLDAVVAAPSRRLARPRRSRRRAPAEVSL